MNLPALLCAVLLAAQVSAPRPTVRPKTTPTPSVPDAPLKIRSRKERMDRYLVTAMRKTGIDSWLVVTREGAVDPIAFDVAADHAVGRAACLFVDKGDRLERVAVVASYDTEPFEKSGLYTRVVPYGKEGAGPALKGEIEGLNPKAIAVDMSRDEPLADGITAGNLQWLRDTIGPDYAKRLVSAEAFLVSYRSRKTPAEIAKLKDAVKKSELILAEALTPAVVVAGKTTEKDVADFIRKRRREMGLAPSWEEDQDPNVMAGLARGHSAASGAMILPGSVIRVDFGVDEDGYKTDIQRLAYVLRPGETEAPPEVAAAFATVRAANRAAAAALTPGATGTAVDTAARKVVTDAGYEEFKHATGHPIGFYTHDIGPLLAPAWPDRYGKLGTYTIERDQTFAIEPALEVELPWMMGGVVGFGLEEDYVVTEKGSEPLGTPQETLILIPGAP
ncbi:MAG TPA: M24 family metallopeptidase [Thermoanaerobaculia bacterium]|jgi:Xaa-Pro dipeptidase|nr:M24 family metallopeptidase [Thermoanaerobaculia bacterium]